MSQTEALAFALVICEDGGAVILHAEECAIRIDDDAECDCEPAVIERASRVGAA